MLVVPLLLACAGATRLAQTNVSGANRPSDTRLPPCAVAPICARQTTSTTNTSAGNCGGDDNKLNMHANSPQEEAKESPTDRIEQGQAAAPHPAAQTAQTRLFAWGRHGSSGQMCTKTAGALRMVGGADAQPNNTPLTAANPVNPMRQSASRGEKGSNHKAGNGDNKRRPPSAPNRTGPTRSTDKVEGGTAKTSAAVPTTLPPPNIASQHAPHGKNGSNHKSCTVGNGRSPSFVPNQTKLTRSLANMEGSNARPLASHLKQSKPLSPEACTARPRDALSGG